MAATIFQALLIFIYISHNFVNFNPQRTKNYAITLEFTNGLICDSFEAPLCFKYQLCCKNTRESRVKRAILIWTRRGVTHLATPENYIVLDITICCDIQPNPGPGLNLNETDQLCTS